MNHWEFDERNKLLSLVETHQKSEANILEKEPASMEIHSTSGEPDAFMIDNTRAGTEVTVPFLDKRTPPMEELLPQVNRTKIPQFFQAQPRKRKNDEEVVEAGNYNNKKERKERGSQ